MIVSVAIATIVGVLGAWAASMAQQSDQWLVRLTARLFFVSMVICIATPLILHAAAWESTAGKFGWLSMTQVGAGGYAGLWGLFNGLIACGWIHGIFGSSLVALATWYGTQTVSDAVVQQSQMERGPIATWWRVRLPVAMPWVSTAMLATAAMAATEMTVVDLYGYRTLADRFYLQYIVDPTAASIARTLAMPILLAGVFLSVCFSRIDSPHVAAGNDDSFCLDVRPPKIVAWIAGVTALFIAAVVVAVPLSGIVIKAGHEVVVVESQRTISWSPMRFVQNVSSSPLTFAAEYQWTLLLAAIVGFVSVVAGWILVAAGRSVQKLGAVMDFFSIVMVLIPGPIVGLSIVSFFQLDVPGFRYLYHQTLLPLVIGLLVRALPVSYWILRARYRGIGENIIHAARLEMNWRQRLWCVDRKLIARTMAAAGVGSAIVASGDVPVMLPIIPPGVTTVGTRLFEQLHSGARYQEASLAFWYVGAVVVFAYGLVRLNSEKRGIIKGTSPTSG